MEGTGWSREEEMRKEEQSKLGGRARSRDGVMVRERRSHRIGVRIRGR